MTYIATRMPEKLEKGFAFGPRWKTTKVPLANGRSQKNGDWLFPLFEGRGNMAAFNDTDRAALLNLSMAARGELHAFRVRVPTYWTATNEPIVTFGGVTYLSRAHTFGSETAYKLVQAPVTATLSGAGSVDMDTGVVTGASPGDTWSGTFDMWMSFAADFNPFAAASMQVWTQDIELIEVRR